MRHACERFDSRFMEIGSKLVRKLFKNGITQTRRDKIAGIVVRLLVWRLRKSAQGDEINFDICWQFSRYGFFVIPKIYAMSKIFNDGRHEIFNNLKIFS